MIRIDSGRDFGFHSEFRYPPYFGSVYVSIHIIKLNKVFGECRRRLGAVGFLFVPTFG